MVSSRCLIDRLQRLSIEWCHLTVLTALTLACWSLSLLPSPGDLRAQEADEIRKGSDLPFVAQKRPIIQRLEFRGNTRVKVKQLKAWTGLKAGSPFDYVAIQEAAGRIGDQYRSRGFDSVKVTFFISNEPGDREVIFDIKEGTSRR